MQLKKAALAYLAFVWCTFVYAADTPGNPLVTGLESIPLKALVYVLVLSVVGGAAGTLNRLSRTDIVIRNLTLEIIKDGFMSLFAGGVTFLFTSWTPAITFWPQAILITFAGYGGSKVVDMMFTDGALPAFRGLIQRLFNTGPKNSGGAQ